MNVAAMESLPDLHTPRYTKAEILRLVPGLSATTLQNWVYRGVVKPDVERPGSKGKLYWTPASVVYLRTILSLTHLGFKPSEVVDIGYRVVEEIEDFISFMPREIGEDGFPGFTMKTWEMDKMRRGVVSMNDGLPLPEVRHTLTMMDRGEVFDLYRTITPYSYVVVEVDVIILASLNAIIRHEREKEAKK